MEVRSRGKGEDVADTYFSNHTFLVEDRVRCAQYRLIFDALMAALFPGQQSFAHMWSGGYSTFRRSILLAHRWQVVEVLAQFTVEWNVHGSMKTTS